MYRFYAEWGLSLLQAQGGQAGGDVGGGVWLVLAAVAGSGFTTFGAVLSVYLSGRLLCGVGSEATVWALVL